MICYFCNKNKNVCNQHKCVQANSIVFFEFNLLYQTTLDIKDVIIFYCDLNYKNLQISYYNYAHGKNLFSTKYDKNLNKLELYDLCTKTIPLKLKKSSHFI